MSVLLDRPHRVRRGAPPSRARLLAAVAALFTFDGAVFGSWAARIPDVTTQVGASHTALGLALLCVSIGALASMQLAGALCARLGAGLVATASAVLICVAVILPGLARSLPELAAALLAFGAATGAVNVAANSAGVRIEAAGNRPIMPGLHAAFSFGGLVGAALGGLASGLGPVAPHLLVVAGVGLLLTAVIAPVLVGGDAEQRAADPVGRAGERSDRPEPKRATTAPRQLLVLLGLIAGCTAYGEGAITDWGASAPARDPGGHPGRRRRRVRGVLTGDGLRAAGGRAARAVLRGHARPRLRVGARRDRHARRRLRPGRRRGPGRVRTRRAGPGERLPARDRPRRLARQGRRGWPWRRRWATRACSAARP